MIDLALTTKYIQEGISEKKYDYLLVELQYRYIHDKSNMRKQGGSKNEKANYCVAGYTLMLRILDYIEVHSEKMTVVFQSAIRITPSR